MAKRMSLTVVPIIFFNSLTRDKEMIEVFHFRSEAIIPLSGVLGAVNGDVGRSRCCALVRKPALIVDSSDSFIIFGNFKGFLANPRLLFTKSSNSLGKGFGLYGLGSGISLTFGPKSKIDSSDLDKQALQYQLNTNLTQFEYKINANLIQN